MSECVCWLIVRRGPGPAQRLLQPLVGGRHHQTPALRLQPERKLRLQLPACSPTVSLFPPFNAHFECDSSLNSTTLRHNILLSKPIAKRTGHEFVNESVYWKTIFLILSTD